MPRGTSPLFPRSFTNVRHCSCTKHYTPNNWSSCSETIEAFMKQASCHQGKFPPPSSTVALANDSLPFRACENVSLHNGHVYTSGEVTRDHASAHLSPSPLGGGLCRPTPLQRFGSSRLQGLRDGMLPR